MSHTRATIAPASLALAAAFVVGLIVAAPAHATTEAYESIAGDPAYLEHGAECLDAVGFEDRPIAGAPTCAILYGHIFDLLSDIYINVQGLPSGQPDLARGFTSYVTAETAGFDLNELELYSTPGFVEYGSPEDVEPLLHPERGITKDIRLSKDVPVLGYWYMSADAEELSTAGGDNTPVDAGAMPCLTVRMQLETGRVHGQGQVLAEGATTKTVITDGMTEEQVALAQMDCSALGGDPDADTMKPNDVTEFRVDLGVPLADIPATKAFLIHVEWYQWAPSGGDGQDKAAQREWNLHTGPDHPNRVVLALENPLAVEEVRPVPFDGRIYVRSQINSPWGSYDIDPGSVRLRILDEAGQEVPNPTVDDPRIEYSTGHEGHFKPMAATFAWHHEADDLDPGTYTLEVSARNWQHTGEAIGRGTVVIGEPGQAVTTYDHRGIEQANEARAQPVVEESPLVGPSALLALIGLALAAFRRRHG